MSSLKLSTYDRISVRRAERLLAEPPDYSGDGWHRAGRFEETTRRLLEIISDLEGDKRAMTR
ncbi:MAG: hypothetical protein ACRDT6_01615 [Micromonosporaceae bacterium]